MLILLDNKFVCSQGFYHTGSEILVKQTNGNDPKPFYSTKEEGFYFYKENKILKIKKERDKSVREGRKPAKKTLEELWNMFPDDFHRYERKALKYAVYTANPEDVELYLKVLEVAKMKSEQFANVVSFVGYQKPELYMKENYTFPTNATGIRAHFRKRNADIRSVIEKNKHEYGLIILTQASCEACKEQKDVLDYFYNRYQWLIQDYDISKKPYLTEKFKVSSTPTIILISKKSKKTQIVSAGIITLEQLENNIYKGIKILSGARTPQMFNMYDYNFTKKDFSDDGLVRLLKNAN